MLFILDGLRVGFRNPPLNLEDKALYPIFAHSHLSHLVPSAATLPATALPAFPVLSHCCADQVCGHSWVWSLGLQTDKVLSRQKLISWYKEQSVSPPC